MAYDARPAELTAALETAGFTPADKDAVRRALDEYARTRAGWLDDLVKLLGPDGGDEASARAWHAYLERVLSGILRTFENAPQPTRSWLAMKANEEYSFFHLGLMANGVARHRDWMFKQKKALTRAIREFEDKWNAIKQADRDIDDRMQAIAKEYGEIMDKAASEAAELEKSVQEKVIALVRKGLTVGGFLVDWGLIETVIKQGARAIGLKIDQTEARKYEIQAMLSREQQVVTMFVEARRLVDDFLKDNGYPQIKDAWDQGQRQLDRIAEASKTDGQRRDAAELKGKLDEQLKQVYEVAEREYKEFARKHERLFFGPVDETFCQELLEDSTWKQFSEGWKRRKEDIDDLLRDRMAVSESRLYTISTDGLSDGDKKVLHEKALEANRELLAAWNKWKSMTNDPYWVLNSREELKRVIQALR